MATDLRHSFSSGVSIDSKAWGEALRKLHTSIHDAKKIKKKDAAHKIVGGASQNLNRNDVDASRQ